MWKHLKPGDVVDIVAPSSGLSLERLHLSEALLKEWGLEPRVSSDIFGDDLLYANDDNKRLTDLKQALYAPDSSAVWCLRGGSGATRLIAGLRQHPPPTREKLLIGFSDITCLHIFANQAWHWSPIHGPALSQIAEGKVSQESIQAIKDIIFGQKLQINFSDLLPLNAVATQGSKVKAELTGGNLSLVQCSIGTTWEIETKGKIVFLEEVNEPAYRIVERIEHLRQAHLLDECAAIVLGEFTPVKEQEREPELLSAVLRRFASEVSVPVLSTQDIGHGRTNLPVPIGMPCSLSLGTNPSLLCNFVNKRLDNKKDKSHD